MRFFMFCLVAFLAASTARAEILFHDRAFADAVVDSNLLSGYNDPTAALGRNDWTADMVGDNAWGSAGDGSRRHPRWSHLGHQHVKQRTAIGQLPLQWEPPLVEP